jgi:peptidoglycan/LPS O-acetylase OafA/YrhL
MIGIVLYFLSQSKTWAKAPSIPILKARPIRLTGMVSYSAYLWHFAVLGMLAHFKPLWPADGNPLIVFIVFYPCLVTVTVVLSWITYATVETPAIRLGRTAEVFIRGHFAFSR